MNSVQPARVSKVCEDCQAEQAIAGERYCKTCRKSLFAFLESVGYLHRIPRRFGIFSDMLGRKDLLDPKVFEECAELNGDGDRW